MSSILLMLITFAAYLVAYHTYGRYLGGRIFRLDHTATTPAHAKRDEIDFLPVKREILFGHHFTSIAGTGPIVGPAIGIIWGWVPAILWVVLGSIFMGAVHDFGALVLSVRHGGRSVGDIAAEVVNPRVRRLFLLVIFLALMIVIALFCLVIAVLFKMYPAAVFPVWMEIPIALWLGHMIYRRKASVGKMGIVAVVLMYATIFVGVHMPLALGSAFGLPPLFSWTVILLVYAYIASVLPVWRLLQPRDYINGHELLIVMALLVIGVVAARPKIVAPAYDPAPVGVTLEKGVRLCDETSPTRIVIIEEETTARIVADTMDYYTVIIPSRGSTRWALPKDDAPKPDRAPPILPFLFITIACGAISGFHSLVSSGTSAKQLDNESHARAIGYGGMLTEAALATLVIIAVAAGVGMATGEGGLSGRAAWLARYASWGAAKGLGAKVGAFVDGSANMLAAFGIPLRIGVAIMGVMVASFAGTTLDTATRIQRYVVAEIATDLKIRPLQGRHGATLFAVATAGLMALLPREAIAAFSSGGLSAAWEAFAAKTGTGGLLLWPLFGATNQLLAGLVLLLLTVYLRRRGVAIWYTALPMVFMIAMTGWAMYHTLGGLIIKGDWLLVGVGGMIVALEAWMVVECLIALRVRRDGGPA